MNFLGRETRGEILQTNNYKLFHRMRGNRDVSKSHVRKLIRSMEEKYLPQPITVNERIEIVDGQHRFEAAKELQLPIYYQIVSGTDITDVQRLNNSSKNWAINDSLHMFCERNYVDYLTCNAFMNKYRLSLELSMCLLLNVTSANTPMRDNFKAGNFKVANLPLAEKNAEKILKIKPYYKGWARVSFARALMILFKNPEYDHAVLVKKLKYCSHLLQDKLNSSAYLANIEDIYNFHSKAEYVYLTRRK